MNILLRKMNETARRYLLLFATTGAFVASFSVWVLPSIIGKVVQQELGLSNTKFGVLVGSSIFTGSILRLLFGPLADKYGGRRVFFILMLAVIPPLYAFGAWANEYWHFVAFGLLLGPIGASFAVGMSYIVKWFPKDRQGFAMGIFGSGNIGTAITQFVAPVLIILFGWRTVPKIYSIALLATAFIFLSFTFTDEKHKQKASIWSQFSELKDSKAWRYFQFYSLTFGGFVALALWMPSYYMNAYGWSLAKSAMVVAGAFTLPASMVRIYGGWLSDKYGAYKVTRSVMWVAFLSLLVLSVPHPQNGFTHAVPASFLFGDWRSEFLGLGASIGETGYAWRYTGLSVEAITAVLFILGIAFGIGNASIFKYAAEGFSSNTGTVFGLIGVGGGLGGWLLPIIFGGALDVTGMDASCFLILLGVAGISLVWLYWGFKNERYQTALGMRTGSHKEIPLIYSCSGCSGAAQLTNEIAQRLHQEGIAEMSCIAGIGSGRTNIVKEAKKANSQGRGIIVLDGCKIGCAVECLKDRGIEPTHSIVLSDFGWKKECYAEQEKRVANRIFRAVRDVAVRLKNRNKLEGLP